MAKKNFLSGREKELSELSEQYEAALSEGKALYWDADDLADLADWYGVRHQYKLAIQVVEYGLKLHPNNTALLVELAYLYFDTFKLQDAKKIAEKITEDTPEAIVLKANILLREGKEGEVDTLLDMLEDKDDLGNIIDVAYMYLDMQNPDKAMNWLKRGKGRYEQEEAFLGVMGDCHFAMRDIDTAINYYNRLIDINPYSAPYWMGLAQCYFEMKQYDKAIDACDYALVSDEDYSDAYIMRGHAFYELGNEEASLQSYQEAEQRHALPSCFIKVFLGLNHASKKEWKEAYENFEEAISLSDKENGSEMIPLSNIYANAALCLNHLDNKGKAHKYCQKAKELAPCEIDAYLIEGRIYMEEGNQEEGVNQWSKALHYAPYATTWHEIGLYCLDINNLQYAKLAFERVKELEPDFEGINEKLASIYLVLKDKKNFLEFNRLCKHPIKQEELDLIEKRLENENEKDLLLALKDFFDALH